MLAYTCEIVEGNICKHASTFYDGLCYLYVSIPVCGLRQQYILLIISQIISIVNHMVGMITGDKKMWKIVKTNVSYKSKS